MKKRWMKFTNAFFIIFKRLFHIKKVFIIKLKNKLYIMDYKDIYKKALTEGYYPDKCGEADRLYDFGVWMDLCGMSVEDALAQQTRGCGGGGGGSDTGTTKITNNIVLSMVEAPDGKYQLFVKPQYAPAADVFLNFMFNGNEVEAKLPVSSSEGITIGEPQEKEFANITNIKIATTDEIYTYKANNQVKPIVTYTISFKDGDGKVIYSVEVESGEIPSYEGETPTKKSTAQYEYTWTGEWDKEIVPAISNTTYTATFIEEVRSYLVTFVNWDNTVIKVEPYQYGTIPSCDEPSRDETDEYKYTFKGWNPTISKVIKTITYKAEYTQVKKKYTIIFINYDGTELQKSDIEYGVKPIYKGVTPEKPSTVQYEYAFNGWDEEIVTVTGNKTYTAQFTETLRSYEIKFFDEDGTLLESKKVNYGVLPECSITPTKESDRYYDYSFNNEWVPSITEVSGTAEYKAEYTSDVRIYDVNFIDENGNILQSVGDKEYSEIDTAEKVISLYTEDEPSKECTEESDFIFNGWIEEYDGINNKVNFIPDFISSPKLYTVKFVTKIDEEHTEEVTYEGISYNSISETLYTGDTEEITYKTVSEVFNFAKWSDVIILKDVNEAIYEAEYNSEPRKYEVTIKYLNENGEEITEVKEISYNTKVKEVLSEIPTSDIITDETTFTFIGWEPSFDDNTIIDNNITYTTQYLSAKTQYEVTFEYRNTDGIIVTTSITADYGASIQELINTLDVPTDNILTEDYIYKYNGWNPNIIDAVVVKDNPKYEVVYIVENTPYEITYNYRNENCEETGKTITLISTDIIGEHIPDDAVLTTCENSEYIFTFNGWNNDVNVMAKYGDNGYIAEYTQVKQEYTVTFSIDDTIIGSQTGIWGTEIIYPTCEEEGYQYKWQENKPTVIPVGDITVTGIKVEKPTEPDMLYYGSILKQHMSNPIDMVTTAETLNTIEFELDDSGSYDSGFVPFAIDVNTPIISLSEIEEVYNQNPGEYEFEELIEYAIEEGVFEEGTTMLTYQQAYDFSMLPLDENSLIDAYNTVMKNYSYYLTFIYPSKYDSTEYEVKVIDLNGDDEPSFIYQAYDSKPEKSKRYYSSVFLYPTPYGIPRYKFIIIKK